MRRSTALITSLTAVVGIVSAAGLWRLHKAESQADIPITEAIEAQTAQRSIALEEIKEPKSERQGMKAVKNPSVQRVEQTTSQMPRHESGMVVTFGREQRFYPNSWLKQNNIINDTVGGVAVLVSFCNSCNSGVVFSRNIQGETLEFEISGRTYRSDWLIVDSKHQSWWWQISGEAVIGDLIGQKLEQLSSTVMTLSEFSRAYPKGTVISYKL